MSKDELVKLRNWQWGEVELLGTFTTLSDGVQSLQDIGILPDPIDGVFAVGGDRDPTRDAAVEAIQNERLQLGFRDTTEDWRLGLAGTREDGRRVFRIEHGLKRKPWRVGLMAGAVNGARLDILNCDENAVEFRIIEQVGMRTEDRPHSVIVSITG